MVARFCISASTNRAVIKVDDESGRMVRRSSGAQRSRVGVSIDVYIFRWNGRGVRIPETAR
jgi:hypothetical protein